MQEEIELTKEQNDAINHDRGHLRIIACAGSGKTEVVSRRIAKLIKKGVDPKTIVAFTFTEKAAEELKSRIRRILDTESRASDLGEMYAGTIHSFCFFMLKELDPKYRNYDVLDEPRRLAYVSKYQNYKELMLFPLQKSPNTGNQLSYNYTVRLFLESVNIMLSEGLNPEELSNNHFKESYLKYLEMLEKDKYLDFSTMIRTLVNLLKEDKNMLKKFNKRVKHLVLDEYQDVDRAQEELVELTSLGADSVCVVGDDDQCIFQWRGSQVRYIINFRDKYSKEHDVADVPLNVNFRSTEAIIHTAEKFISKNRNRLDIKKMTWSDKLKRQYELGDIIYRHFENEKEEFDFISTKIGELEGTDFLDKKNREFSLSLGDFAILVRTNAEAAKIISHFDSQGIKCVAYGGEAVFERPEVDLAMDCISYVFEVDRPRYELSRPLTKKELVESIKFMYGEVFNPKEFKKANFKKFYKELSAIRKDIKNLSAKTPKDYLGDTGFQGVYHRILGAMGAGKFNFGDQYNYDLAVLSQAISDYESVWVRLRTSEIKDFFRFINAYGDSSYTDTSHCDPSLVDAVKVMTIHKAKGLEFPVIFVPGCIKKIKRDNSIKYVDGLMYCRERYKGTDEDERRVFYTAFTRSEKYLFITGAKFCEGGAKKGYEPHPFIGELDRKFISDDMPLARPKSGHPKRTNSSAIYPTSFSELASYGRCPYDFQLRHVFGYNAGVPAAFGYGTNIHNIINVIHDWYVQKRKVPANREIDKLFDDIFKLRYATKKMENNMKKSAKKVVKNYVELYKDEFKFILETEKRFEFVMDEAIVSGQIDLIKKIDKTGKVTAVEIIDFKTEDDDKKKDNTYRLDHEKQLRYYAIACLDSLHLSPEKAGIHYLDKSGKKKKPDYVDISTPTLEGTKKEISTCVKGIIQEKDFKAKPSKDCKKCDNLDLCPFKK